jgi:hypothetical protein
MRGVEGSYFQSALRNNHVESGQHFGLAVNGELEAVFQQGLKHRHQLGVGHAFWSFTREVEVVAVQPGGANDLAITHAIRGVNQHF